MFRTFVRSFVRSFVRCGYILIIYQIAVVVYHNKTQCEDEDTMRNTFINTASVFLFIFFSFFLYIYSLLVV